MALLGLALIHWLLLLTFLLPSKDPGPLKFITGPMEAWHFAMWGVPTFPAQLPKRRLSVEVLKVVNFMSSFCPCVFLIFSIVNIVMPNKFLHNMVQWMQFNTVDICNYVKSQLPWGFHAPGGLLASKLCQGLTGHLQSMDAWLQSCTAWPSWRCLKRNNWRVGWKETYVLKSCRMILRMIMNQHEFTSCQCRMVIFDVWGGWHFILRCDVVCTMWGGGSILIPVFRQYIFKSHLAKGFTSPANHTGEIPAYLLLQMRKAEAGRPQAELEIFWTSNVFADGLLHRPSRSSQRDSHRALPVHLARKNWHRCAIGCP